MFRMQGEGNRGPIDDFWYKPLGYNSSHGKVSSDQARRLSVVYACVKVLAETVGHLPLILYKRRADGGKQRVTDHPAARLMRQQPNGWQTPFEFREMMQGHLALRGNAYAKKIFAANGQILQMIPLHPDRVIPQRIAGKMALRYIYTDMDGEQQTLRQSEVLHLRGASDDGLVGLNPVEVERIAVSFGLTTQDYGRRFYENDASAGNWIEFPGKFSDLEARRKFVSEYQASQTGHNRFKTPVLDNGLKLHEMQLKNTDAQFLETRKYQDTDICRIWRMQPHKVGILDNATFSNIEQQALEHVTDTLMPWLTRWEERLSLELLDEDEQEILFFEFLVDGLMRGDSTARSNFYNKGILTGWMTRNEARLLENRNPLPGLDEPLEPLNMQSANAEKAEQDTSTPQGTQNVGQDQEDEQQQSNPKPGKKKTKPTGRAAALERQTAMFLVKKEIQNARGLYGRDNAQAIAGGIQAFYQAHAQLISRSLVVDPLIAATYAEDSKTVLLNALASEAYGAGGAYMAVIERWAETRVNELLDKVHADE